MAVQASAERAWFAIQRFFSNCSKGVPGKKATQCGRSGFPYEQLRQEGYPKFQKDNRSVEYKTSGWKLHPTLRRITFTDKKKIGELKLLGTWDIRTFPVKSIKRVRIVRRADGYYCQFYIDTENSQPLPSTGKEIGIDVGLEVFYADSDGYLEQNPRFLRKSEKRLKRKQRKM